MVQSGRVGNFNRDALVSGDEPPLFDDIRIIPTEAIATLNEERSGLISVDKFIKNSRSTKFECAFQVCCREICFFYPY